MMSRIRPQTFFSVFVLALSGCGGGSSNKVTTHAGTGVGGACQRPTDCRGGLSCESTTHTCKPAGSTIPDAACVLSAECMQG
ncbi:MAG TPA: hypothetical protein VJ801_08705, partial [Polyangia bacterium]|nr:hypothetical protein [Polyangia bacterium]